MGRLNHVWKWRLLAGTAALALVGATPIAARAQLFARTPSPAPLPPGPADQALGKDGFYLEADTIIRDDENHTVTAKGSVEARYNGKVLRADEIHDDQTTGVITAHGDVQLLNPDGTSEFARDMTLDKDFSAGLALAFSTRQEPNVKMVADEAIRLNKDAMALNKAVFTVCDICAADGSPKEPTWSIQAAQVIQDHDHKVIFYRHAVIRVAGIPVAYTPIFWHTDPSAKRGSGFLAPLIALDNRRGFSYQQPYLWVISPYADLVLAPQFDTKVTGILNGEYRERFYSGQIDSRFGYTYAHQFDSNGHTYDNLTSRSYILGSGAFVINPKWTWGFSAERVTDPLLFQRYNIPNAFDPRGLFATDDQRLLSQLYAVEQDSRSYLSMSMLSWQGLRVGDNNGTFPTATPLIEGRYEPNLLILGGRLRLEGGGVLLDRARNPYTNAPPEQDSRRATFGGDWRSSYTFYNGIRLEPFLEGRGDLYNAENPSQNFTGPTQISAKGPVTVDGSTVIYDGNHTTGRLLGTAGIDASWPFFRRTGDLTVILEPLAQLAISPKAVINPYIPNEDSQFVNFDETNLFEYNKSPGFDYYEGGARANVGGRVTFRWDGGAQVQLVGGRSLRTQQDPTLPASSSLNQLASDWVVAATAQPAPGYSAFTRALIDSETDHIRRFEAGLNAGSSRISGFFRYLYDDIDNTTTYAPGSSVPISTTKTENAQFGGQVLVTKHWGLSGSASWDLANKVTPQQAIGLVYQDECTHWELLYQHDGTYNRTLRPSNTIMLRLLLVTLGSTGYQRPDFR
jgi:LPS-assembly protein